MELPGLGTRGFSLIPHTTPIAFMRSVLGSSATLKATGIGFRYCSTLQVAYQTARSRISTGKPHPKLLTSAHDTMDAA